MDLKRYLIGVLRRATIRWGPRDNVRRKALVGRKGRFVLYKCKKCKEDVPRKDSKVDHIKPVVDPKVGFVDWNTYIHRMYVEEKGYQLLCRTCHDKKSAIELKVRQKYRAKKKKAEKRCCNKRHPRKM